MMPPMRTLLPLLLLVLGVTVGGTARALDAKECDANRDQLFADLAANRDKSLRHYDAALAAAASEDDRVHLRAESSEVWHEEEMARGMADSIWRDCLRHVGATPTKR
jgi:hypothetical protein